MSEVLKQKLAQVQRCQARYCRWNKKNQCTKIFITVDDEGACQQFDLYESPVPIGEDRDVGNFSYLSATDV